MGYSTEFIAITVGANGNIGKWDLISNVCKTYDKLLATFKPTSMSCSSHKALNVAVGTKQGVVFVLDLTGNSLYSNFYIYVYTLVTELSMAIINLAI